ncbi:gag/pol protein [Cucumis melo var. makuwa]|uniref:Gag/pol protein n=1 Tax=Cucumis melo var. makuwa TaxID=1194695 RepID=A0A5A7TKU2_CUCMM|nr:gag/pol protein [Cucumis melo var. makuwa]
MTKRSFNGKGLRAKTPLELVHSDLCGPMMSKLGEDTNISSVLLMIIQGKTIKTFRSDRGGEYMNLRFQDYLIEHGIQSQLSAPSTPQQNGYPKESKGGLFYDPQENKVFVSTNATFLEEDHIRNHQTRSKLVLEEISKNTTDRPSSSTKVVDKTRNIGQTHSSQELGEPPHSGRIVRQPNRYLGLSEAQIIIPDDGIEDSLAYKQAMNDVDCDQWIKAMDLEMESMYSNSVWTLVDQPNDVKPIGCKWIYKRKRDQAGKMDVKIAFLNGNLEESIYMVQLEGYGIHLSKEQCPKTPEKVEDMSNIPYASAVKSLMYAMLYARKPTSGSVFTLNGGAVVWRSIKQSYIANSTMEAEYVAACEAIKEAAWLKKFLTDLEVVPNMHMPITLYCDNSGEIANSREPRSHK